MSNQLHWLKNYLYLCLISAFSVGLGGCAYSLSGAAVPEHWKAVFVPLFEDDSNYGQQLLREDLTNMMITKL